MFRRLALVVPLLVLAAGCAGGQGQLRPYVPTVPVRGVVFAVDGAGGYGGTSETLVLAIQEQGLPLAVVPFAWSHGTGRVLADQTDLCHAEEQGRRLACDVLLWRRQYPDL